MGEGPGPKEVEKGRPFVGPTGRLLDQMLKAGGLDRSEAWVTNATLCLPKSKGDKEMRDAIACCRPRLMGELAATPDVPVMFMGGHAVRAGTTLTASIDDVRGFDVTGFLRVAESGLDGSQNRGDT